MKNGTTRDQIVKAADLLFYQHGYAHTSFTDIAANVNISRGNFYYHFKTKDEILNAVIEQRLVTTQHMLKGWEIKSETPYQRIQSFIHVLLTDQNKIEKYGCSVGSLCIELAKLNHGSQDQANKLLTLFRVWLKHQFEDLGHKDRADELAMHLLAHSQGVASLANAFQEKDFMTQEVQKMNDWLKSL
ncbi:MAG: TetR/AcrR family transcriptional regulator [Magnetovibrio sp.]|nr:TetR/AcrR family transcriptional regulator [Magnetovibrio sp.]